MSNIYLPIWSLTWLSSSCLPAACCSLSFSICCSFCMKCTQIEYLECCFKLAILLLFINRMYKTAWTHYLSNVQKEQMGAIYLKKNYEGEFTFLKFLIFFSFSERSLDPAAAATAGVVQDWGRGCWPIPPCHWKDQMLKPLKFWCCTMLFHETSGNYRS